jgi:hypothetical protein
MGSLVSISSKGTKADERDLKRIEEPLLLSFFFIRLEKLPSPQELISA